LTATETIVGILEEIFTNTDCHAFDLAERFGEEAGEPLRRIRFWHFYLKKVRTIEQINVFNDLRQNNR
jgi:hypothetical protein